MIDGHVHVIGTGAGGTGCWLRRRGLQRFLAPVLVRGMGLRMTDLDGDFDHIFAERLLKLVRGAGLRSALLLAQEDIYTEQGQLVPDRAAFYVPNAWVLELARRHPEFVPAISIHPARPDALEELERCLAGGAAVFKCLPNCQNIDPRLPRYRRFWERLAEAGLPLLAHTGGEGVLPVVRADLQDPRVLAAPLEIGVTVIAAHCGTAAAPGEVDYFPAFCDMVPRFPRLYGDNSCLCYPRKLRRVPAMRAPGIAERILHGSDFPVPVQPFWSWIAGAVGWREYRRLRAIGNPLARDVALKRAVGFGEDTFTRLASIWRRPPENRTAPPS